MKPSFKDFFKKGEFWTSLEDTLNSVKSTLNKHTKSLKKRAQNEVLLAQQVKHLAKENVELIKRFDVIEERLWQLNSSPSRNNEIIIPSENIAIEAAKKSEIEHKPSEPE